MTIDYIVNYVCSAPGRANGPILKQMIESLIAQEKNNLPKNVIDTSAPGNVYPKDVRKGKVVFVNGKKVTGSAEME